MVHFPKSPSAPKSLAEEKNKVSGKYNCADVIEQLQKDFKNKCYICEDKEPHAINVEHFIPHKGDAELKFQWANLFFCCAHCNNTKGAKQEFDHILNCTTDADIDRKIKYWMNPFPMQEINIAAEVEYANDANTLSTVQLLKEIYGGTTATKKLESDNIRKKLLKEIKNFQEQLIKYYHEHESFHVEERNELRQSIIRELRAASCFTAFKRWVIRICQYTKDFPETEWANN
ncbi:MAG: HNH endonuclease [Verrucomicrobiales bacterium]|jgi:hypothetical protein|nr:HNH endonuclease [Verrucomicrobiales bacterium]